MKHPTFISLRKTILGALTIAVLLFAAAGARAENLDQAVWPFAEFYKYDKTMPLDLVEKFEREGDNFKLHHWTFNTTHGKKVTAFYSTPKTGAGPFPVILILHGYGGSKNEGNEGFTAAAAAGYACLALDAEYHGERKVEGKQLYSKLAYSTRDAMIQTVMDYRRAIDLLETRPEADTKRIGFIGGSMGGILGAVLAGVEPRVRSAVLIVGGADWSYLARASVVSQALGLTKGDNPLDPKKFGAVIAPVDPVNWAQNISPRPTLMLNGKFDVLVNPESNRILFARLKPPKKIVWFQEGHGLPIDVAMKMSIEFFDSYVKGDRDPAEIGSKVEGYKTKPLPMKLKKPLPPEPVASMPLAKLFDYESFLPLKDEMNSEPDSMLKRRFTVGFQSVHDRTAPGSLYLPPESATARKTAIIFLHEVGASREQAREIAPPALGSGFAVLAVDLPGCGERALPGALCLIDPALPYTSRDNLIQTVFDVRRAMDFLAARGIADTAVIVTSGAAAEPAMAAAAIDPRIASVITFGPEAETAIHITPGGPAPWRAELERLGKTPKRTADAVDAISMIE